MCNPKHKLTNVTSGLRVSAWHKDACKEEEVHEEEKEKKKKTVEEED